MKLEECLESAFMECRVYEPYKGLILNFLDSLKIHDSATYEHSVRAGLLSYKIAESMQLDPKPALYGGLLHDIGKSQIDPALLKKGDKFTEDDMYKVKDHVMKGYDLLKEIFPFSAEIMVRHHSYQDKPYPDIPHSRIILSESAKVMINVYSRIIALADFYDALVTRKNKKFVGESSMTEKDFMNILIKNNPDQEYRIKLLSESRVFQEFYDKF